jgi:hypothetical protein
MYFPKVLLTIEARNWNSLKYSILIDFGCLAQMASEDQQNVAFANAVLWVMPVNIRITSRPAFVEVIYILESAFHPPAYGYTSVLILGLHDI